MLKRNRMIVLMAVLGTSAALEPAARGGLIDWDVTPGGTQFNAGQYADWLPGAGVNPNNSHSAASGVVGSISYTIWDGFGPHGNATAGGNHDDRDFGGQQFDVKAMFARNDASNLYIGIVTGFNPNGVTDPYNSSIHLIGGDLAIDPDFAHNTSRLGIDTISAPAGSSGTFNLVSGGTWNVPNQNVGFTPPPDSNYLSGGTVVGTASYSLTDLGIDYADPVTGHNVTTYLYEYTLPLSELGKSPGQTVDLSWAMSCSNDSLELTHTLTSSPQTFAPPPSVVPEPNVAAVIVGAAMIPLVKRPRRKIAYSTSTSI